LISGSSESDISDCSEGHSDCDVSCIADSPKKGPDSESSISISDENDRSFIKRILTSEQDLLSRGELRKRSMKPLKFTSIREEGEANLEADKENTNFGSWNFSLASSTKIMDLKQKQPRRRKFQTSFASYSMKRKNASIGRTKNRETVYNLGTSRSLLFSMNDSLRKGLQSHRIIIGSYEKKA